MTRQKLGQHFLDSESWQARIAAKLPRASGQLWVEIGPGRGQLTRYLAEGAKQIVAIEADRRLADDLGARFSARPDIWGAAEVIQADVLSVDFAALSAIAALGPEEKFRVYGNLPYYITSPILHHLFRWADRIASVHIVIQREVAERIVARPASSDYGYLSVACQYYGQPRIELKIPPGAFRPPPKVDSALVAMTMPGACSLFSPLDSGSFLRFVQACFAHKRKTLRNNLIRLAPDERVRGAMTALQLGPDARAEQLSLPQFVQLMSAVGGRF